MEDFFLHLWDKKGEKKGRILGNIPSHTLSSGYSTSGKNFTSCPAAQASSLKRVQHPPIWAGSLTSNICLSMWNDGVSICMALESIYIDFPKATWDYFFNFAHSSLRNGGLLYTCVHSIPNLQRWYANWKLSIPHGRHVLARLAPICSKLNFCIGAVGSLYWECVVGWVGTTREERVKSLWAWECVA